MENNENMEQENTQEPIAETVETKTSSGKKFNLNEMMNSNRKRVMIGGGILLGILALILGYKYFIADPMEQEAETKVFMAEQYFGMDSSNLAINGDGKHPGLKEIADEYSGTKAGKRASYLLGRLYMEQGKFDDAIELLEDYDLGDKMVQPLATGLIGDCYIMKKDLDKGVSYYIKAAETSKLEFPSPYFYKKAGLVYERLKQYDKALSVYETVQKEYAKTPEASDIEKYIARVKTQMEEGEK